MYDDDDDDDMRYIDLYVTCKYLYLYYLVDSFLLEFLFYSMIWPYAKTLNPSNFQGSVVELCLNVWIKFPWRSSRISYSSKSSKTVFRVLCSLLSFTRAQFNVSSDGHRPLYIVYWQMNIDNWKCIIQNKNECWPLDFDTRDLTKASLIKISITLDYSCMQADCELIE